MTRIGFILSILITLSACTSIRYDNAKLDQKGNTFFPAIVHEDQKKIEKLQQAIMALGPNIVPSEANFVAREAVLYPKVLANRYNLMSPALYHNALVNFGRRTRGLCWQWTHDMDKHINRPMTSLHFFHGVAFEGSYWREHSTLVVAAKGKDFQEGIVLDPWRNSGDLYWNHVKGDTKYPWVLFSD